MSNLHKVVIHMYVLLCLSVAISGLKAQQITYTAAFTQKIEKLGIEMYEPVESLLHVYPLEEDDFMAYDLVLQNDINDFEVRFRIRPENGKWQRTPENVEVLRLLTSVATNDLEADIRRIIPEDGFFVEAYNATGGFMAKFVPKETYSEKQYGTLVSIYREGVGAIDIVLLYHDAHYSAYNSFRGIRFD